MNTTTPRIDSSLPNGSPLPGAEWMQALATCAVQAQQLQLEALLSWQQAAVAINSEIWDEWACRFAGGVPIDS